MSRKDNRRAIALCLPSDLRSALRVGQQAPARKRGLMDTLRRAVEAGLARQEEPVPVDTVAPIPAHAPMLLQLPRATREGVHRHAMARGCSLSDTVIALARLGLAE